MSVESSVKAFMDVYLPGLGWSLSLPDDPTYPAGTYQAISQVPGELHIDGGGMGFQGDRFQLDIKAQDYAAAKAAAKTMREAAHGFSGDFYGTTVAVIQVESGIDGYDPSAKIYRHILDLLISY